jgi:hypothetical protein
LPPHRHEVLAAPVLRAEKFRSWTKMTMYRIEHHLSADEHEDLYVDCLKRLRGDIRQWL